MCNAYGIFAFCISTKTYHQGSYAGYSKHASGRPLYPPPLAHRGSFLTNNYCSSCFLWSDDVSRCRLSPEHPQFLSSDWPNYDWGDSNGVGERCALATLPIRVVKWTEPWPEGHRHPLVSFKQKPGNRQSYYSFNLYFEFPGLLSKLT